MAVEAEKVFQNFSLPETLCFDGRNTLFQGLKQSVSKAETL